MQEKSSLAPPCSPCRAAEETLSSARGSEEDKNRMHSRPRFSAAGRGLVKSFWGAVALAILIGAALGFELGMRAGGLGPSTRTPIAETAWLEAAGAAEVARLRDDVRSLRAQIEQLRHLAETSRTAERPKAFEMAHEPSAAQAQLAGSTPTKLDLFEARLERLERAGADATPTGLIHRPVPKNQRKAATP
jgi:hypothetical protein